MKKILVALMIFIFTFGVGFFYKVKPLQMLSTSKRQEIVTMKIKIAEINILKASNETAKISQHKTTVSSEKIKLIDSLIEDLVETKLKLLKIEFQEVDHNQELTGSMIETNKEKTTKVRLLLSGEDQGLWKLINSFFCSSNLITVDELSIINSENNAKNLTINLLLSQQPIATANQDLLIDITKSLFAIGQDNKKTGLEAWYCEELQFVGMVKTISKTYGLVKDSSGKLHRVVRGSKIGPKQVEVIQIDKLGISVIENDRGITRKCL
jgi:Pilus assembly protein, PilP.